MGRVESAELGRWFDTHGASLVLYARQWLELPAAEDVVQEVFVRLAGLSERPMNVRAWLLTCVRNGTMDAMRSRKRSAARDQRAAEERMFELRGRDVKGQVSGEEVEAALRKLGQEQREVITLRIWNSATFEEIAAVTQLPLSTVYHRYKTGLEELKARWEQPCRKE